MKLRLALLWLACFLPAAAVPAAGAQDSDTRIYLSQPDRPGITVLDPDSLETIRTLADESSLAFAGTREAIYLVRPDTVTVLDRVTLLRQGWLDWKGYPDPGTCRVWPSPDGKFLFIGMLSAGGRPDSGIHVVDLEQGREVEVIGRGQLSSGNFTWSADGHLLYLPANPIQIMDAQTRKLIQTLPLPEGARVADLVAGKDALLALVQARPDDATRLLAYHAGRTAELALPQPATRLALASPDILYALGPRHLFRIDLADGRITETLPHGGQSMTYRPERQQLVVFSGLSRRLLVFDVRTNSLVRWLDIPSHTIGFLH